MNIIQNYIKAEAGHHPAAQGIPHEPGLHAHHVWASMQPGDQCLIFQNGLALTGAGQSSVIPAGLVQSQQHQWRRANPHTENACKSSYKELCDKFNCNRDVRFRNALGIPPLKRFSFSSRVFSCAKLPSVLGMLPDSVLELRSSTFSCCIVSIEEAIDPLKELYDKNTVP